MWFYASTAAELKGLSLFLKKEYRCLSMVYLEAVILATQQP
jgi:hypothetical protein